MVAERGDQAMEENVVQLAVYLPSLPSYSKTRCEWKFEAPFWGLCLTSLRSWAKGNLAVWWSLCQSAEASPDGSQVQVLCSMWARETQTSPSQRPGEIGSEEAFLLFFFFKDSIQISPFISFLPFQKKTDILFTISRAMCFSFCSDVGPCPL